VLKEMLDRNGIVTRTEAHNIADICEMSIMEVTEIVDARNAAGRYINELVNNAVKYSPINSADRRVAYAQKILDNTLDIRARDGLPMSDRDPIEILDYVRRETNPTGINVLNVHDNDFSGAQMFAFLKNVEDEELDIMIEKLAKAIENGEDLDINDIVDAEYRDI
jgi:hypothetical protein